MRIVTMVGLVVALAAPAAAQGTPGAETQALAALHGLVQADRGTAWRTDSWVDGDGELVIRLTPSDPVAERARVRRSRPDGIEARARLAADGAVARVTIRDPGRPGLHVAQGATDAARAAVLARARFGADGRGGVLTAARGRGWRGLGDAATVDDGATLVWRAVEGGRERALWRARLTAQWNGQPVAYIVSLDPADGSLVELVREEGQ